MLILLLDVYLAGVMVSNIILWYVWDWKVASAVANHAIIGGLSLVWPVLLVGWLSKQIALVAVDPFILWWRVRNEAKKEKM